MTIYRLALPPEPPDGTKLIDNYGEVWTRTNGLWEGTRFHYGNSTWSELLHECGPLTTIIDGGTIQGMADPHD